MFLRCFFGVCYYYGDVSTNTSCNFIEKKITKNRGVYSVSVLMKKEVKTKNKYIHVYKGSLDQSLYLFNFFLHVFTEFKVPIISAEIKLLIYLNHLLLNMIYLQYMKWNFNSKQVQVLCSKCIFNNADFILRVGNRIICTSTVLALRFWWLSLYMRMINLKMILEGNTLQYF